MFSRARAGDGVQRTTDDKGRSVSAAHAACASLTLAMALGAGSCTPNAGDARPPVAVALQLVTRQSCGTFSGLDYDTTCLAAVAVRVLDETGTQVHAECRLLDDKPRELREMLLGEPLLDFAALSTSGTFTFEVRGIHDVAFDDEQTPLDLCDQSANSMRWLLWGRSAPLDLASLEGKSSFVVPVVVDCRDCTFACGEETCFGCQGFGPGCPAELPSSVCAPTVATCAKGCETDDDCFEGARTCLQDTCDTTTITGRLCSPCGGGTGCADGFACVTRADDAPGFCAPLCPDELCPRGTSCTRLGNRLFIKQ